MKLPEEIIHHRVHITLAWIVLAASLLTYLLTLEPTVSYWDCPEYVTVAYGVQPGHPPGNPVWTLAARFFINFAPSIEYVPLMVNALSAVCSALTVLLTFLATSLLARDLVSVRTPPRRRTWLTEGAGLVAAFALCWSDTFWFSAVEAEVYAFSSLTTALLFWLTLVWSKRVRLPHADRYLIAIAYILGLSIGVHELNLLCLPALLLIVAFTMREVLNKRRIAAFMICAIIAIALVLYGLIPGFMSLAERMEWLCVNHFGLSFNTGALLWWLMVMVLFMAAVASLHIGGNRRQMLTTVVISTVAVGCSGLFFFSGNLAIGISFTLIIGGWLFYRAWHGKLNIRRLRISMWCLAMVLLGFSAYAVLMVRAASRPPLNTGEPSDIFAMHRYFSREQYGKTPLVYGPAFTARPLRMRSWNVNAQGDSTPVYILFRTVNPRPHIVRAVPGMKPKPRSAFATKADSAENARILTRSHGYLLSTYDYDIDYQPEMCMWFPRMTSRAPYDINGYTGWSGADSSTMARITDVTMAVDSAGNPVDWPGAPTEPLLRPTYMQNLQFFLIYQCSYMYWRYFLWNFVGRQNDYAGHGEPDCGNFITGFTPLDEAMLDNVSNAPAEIADGNKGRNVYYMLPLLLGILGIIAQCRAGERGRRQALVILTLFIVTGIAIVFYLNQGPAQARDRDYSFAGSFYAWCIWMGLGVIGLWRLLQPLMRRNPGLCSWIAIIAGLAVPLQMLSQTADDHDRSGRTATRDLAINQLVAMKPRAILFSAEDNYLFPTIYLQHVERLRPDVRMISMPYMVTDWYSRQLRLPLRDGSRLPIEVPEGLMASSWLTNISLGTDTTWTEALPALRRLYASVASQQKSGYALLPTPRLFIDLKGDTLRIDLRKASGGFSSFLRPEALLTIDLLAANAAQPEPRPVYVVSSVANSLLGGQLQPYLSQVGTVSELNPSAPRLDASTIARLALRRWSYGGAGKKPAPYFDPVAAHNLSVQRRVILQAAYELSATPATARYALQLIELTEREMPAEVAPFEAIPDPDNLKYYTTEGLLAARTLQRVATHLTDTQLSKKSGAMRISDKSEAMRISKKSQAMREAELKRLQSYEAWAKSIRPSYRRYISFRVQHLIDALQATRIPLSQ